MILRSLVRSPLHPFYLLWTSLVCLICLFFVLEVIFVCSFSQVILSVQVHTKGIYSFLAFLLVLDIPLNFFKGVTIKGRLSLDSTLIASKYLKAKIVVDTVSTLALILSIAINSSAAVYLRLCMAVRLYDLYLMESVIFRMLLNHENLRKAFVLGKILLIELFCIHLFGCVFYAISYSVLQEDEASNYQNSWLTNSQAYSPIISLPIAQQYMWVFYSGASALTTIVIGDIVGHNPVEVGLMYVIIVIGTISAAYAFEEVMTIWASSYWRVQQFLIKLQAIVAFMERSRVPRALQHQIQSFLEHHSTTQVHLKQHNETMTKLSEGLKNKMLCDKFATKLTSIQAFSIFPSDFLSRVLAASKEVSYFEDEVVNPYTSPSSSSLFLLSQGKLKHFYQYDKNSKLLPSFTKEEVYVVGIEELMGGFPSRRVAMAQGRVHGVSIQRSSLMEIAKEYVCDWETLQQMAHSLVFYGDHSCLGQSCECCEESTHNVFNCPECHVVVSREENTAENTRQKFDRVGNSNNKKIQYFQKSFSLRGKRGGEVEDVSTKMSDYSARVWERVMELQENRVADPQNQEEDFEGVFVSKSYNCGFNLAE